MDYTHLMILIWSLWAASLLLTVMRGITRWHSQRQIFADDYFVFGGILSLTGLTAVITRLLPQFYLAGAYAAAVMQDPTTPMPLPPDVFIARTQTSLKLMFSQMLLFWTTLWAAKFSILFFFRRLLNGLPKYIKAWWGCFAVVLLLYLACMLSNFLTCKPLAKYWSSTGCSDPEDLVRADASIKFATSADVVADAIVMILPLNILRKLQINARQKFGLAMIFSLGIIIIAFALARLAQVTKATSNATKDPATVADAPVLLSMWSHIESSVSIIVATLPAFRYLLNVKIGRTQGRSNTRERSGGKTTSQVAGQSRTRRVLSGQWGGSLNTSMSQKGSVTENDWGSETELRPIQGIEKRVEYSSTSGRRTSTSEDLRSESRA
ncbi:uncharacterized protein M421DRAFT_8791 [Didymella exigua CBS 183.55]|uniref:Rhodopsin domain-containing protein n=1 Tax=Didymella exigua CBS 183.55 TaxID=1150837 RepID=A0A6A5RBB1_9PLEO|nr:uncharacterized protein M421DRAFT_8791 [Didymella exigua CBS 183.55]KAF1924488.1 hypothetical protein M421DRAFT_8791 [Didymella exigua CBS 183.55]